MIHHDTITDLFRHMEWADAAVWTAALAAVGAQTDDKLREGLYHLHLVQRAFMRIWSKEAPDAPYPAFQELPALMRWGRSYYEEVFPCIKRFNDEELSAPMQMPWARLVAEQLSRDPAATTLGESALQVAMHSHYHRGQINARLRAVGGEPPTVDYITWVWLDRPAPVWPPVSIDGMLS
jgi:uncharacterized damage-inducible protein DinB